MVRVSDTAVDYILAYMWIQGAKAGRDGAARQAEGSAFHWTADLAPNERFATTRSARRGRTPKADLLLVSLPQSVGEWVRIHRLCTGLLCLSTSFFLQWELSSDGKDEEVLVQKYKGKECDTEKHEKNGAIFTL